MISQREQQLAAARVAVKRAQRQILAIIASQPGAMATSDGAVLIEIYNQAVARLAELEREGN